MQSLLDEVSQLLKQGTGICLPFLVLFLSMLVFLFVVSKIMHYFAMKILICLPSTASHKTSLERIQNYEI